MRRRCCDVWNIQAAKLRFREAVGAATSPLLCPCSCGLLCRRSARSVLHRGREDVWSSLWFQCLPSLFFIFFLFLVCVMDFYVCTWQKSQFNLWLWFTRLAFLLLLLFRPINRRSGSLRKIRGRLMFSEEREGGGCSNLSRFFLWKTCFLFYLISCFGVGQHLYKSGSFDTSHQCCTLVQNCLMKAAAFLFCALCSAIRISTGGRRLRRSAARLCLIGARSNGCPAFLCRMSCVHVDAVACIMRPCFLAHGPT